MERQPLKKEKALEYLLLSLRFLNLLPASGNGEIKIVFQDGVLLDTIKTTRTRVKIKI